MRISNRNFIISNRMKLSKRATAVMLDTSTVEKFKTTLVDHILDLMSNTENYSRADVENDIKFMMDKVNKENERAVKMVENAIGRIKNWHNTPIQIKMRWPSFDYADFWIDLMDPSQEINISHSVYVGPADFTLFFDGTVDDILDVGIREYEPEFYTSDEQESDYDNLVGALQNKDVEEKVLTLYTGRPSKDREDLLKYAEQGKWPRGIWLTDNKDLAHSFGADYGETRDLWKVQVSSLNLRLDPSGSVGSNNYQLYGPELVDVVSAELMGSGMRPLAHRTINMISKNAKKDKPKAGVFITLPTELAKKCPSLGEHDDSKPHVTALFIGYVPKKHEDLLLNIVTLVARAHDPLRLTLDDKASYFPATKHSDGCKVAKLKIISPDLHKFHKELEEAIKNAGMSIDDHFPDYKPHVTLEYMEPPKQKYDGDLPSGSWVADKVQIWNGDKKNTISLGKKKANANMISKRAKVQSADDKPAYKEKKKTDKGYVWIYDDKHVEKRWKEKKEKLKKLEKELKKVRSQYQKDLTSDDERTRAIAAIVGIMDDTAMRIGNEESAKEGTFGATTLKVKHVKGGSGNMTFDFPGKGSIEQHVTLKNNKVIKVVRDLMKGKKKDDFIFEVDGKKIWDRAVNRYLKPLGISAKDLRGFHANRLMREMLKKKDFKEALEEVADIVGHEAATLKNQYLDPELVEKHDKKTDEAKKVKKKSSISKRALGVEPSQHTPVQPTWQEKLAPKPEYGPDAMTPVQQKPELKMPEKEDVSGPMETPQVSAELSRNVANIEGDIANYPDLKNAWNIIAPFLPDGAILKSGWRGDGDQAKIIIDYWRSAVWDSPSYQTWRKNQGFFQVNFGKELGVNLNVLQRIRDKATKTSLPLKRWEIRRLEPLRVKMTTYKPKEHNLSGGPPGALSIAAIGKSAHKLGKAFDVSGVSTSEVKNAALFIHNALASHIQFTNIHPEAQGATHLEVATGVTVPDNNTLSRAINNYQQAKMAKASMRLSKRAKLTRQDARWLHAIKSGVDVLPMSDEEKSDLNMDLGVMPTDIIGGAWKILYPVLTDTFGKGVVRMTSGARTQLDQQRILSDYWYRRTGQRIPKETEDMQMWRQVSRELKRRYGLIVGPPTTGRPEAHLKGNSFDVSGPRGRTTIPFLYEVARVIKMVSRDTRYPVKFTTLVEEENGAVHVNIKEYGDYVTPSKRQRVASNNKISKRAKDEDTQPTIEELYNDLLKSDPPPEVVEEFKQMFSIASIEDDMGMGLDDEMGDWFEKSPRFRWRDDIPDFDIHDANESEASKLADEDPERFFYRALHKEYPDLETKALKNMLKNNAKFYFVFKYHKNEDFIDLLEEAAEALSQQDARAFFYYHVHREFPELGRGAIIQLIDTNPDSFFDLGLHQDYPDFEESANAARNIKDPNKVELEQPEWLNKDIKKPISLRDRNAASEKHTTPKLPAGWADRRMLSLHRVFGPETDLGFVDLDLHGGYEQSKAKEYARKISSKIKSKYGSSSSTIYSSGGEGFHVEFKLKNKMKTDTLRNELRELCEELNESFDGATTGIVKGKGMRTDVTTLKNNGNIRVPYALHESNGGIKKPIGSGDDSYDGPLRLSKRAKKLNKWKDKIPGGLADKKKPEDFDKNQLAKGLKVELEHVNDKQLAQEIAMDHLTEDPKYYDKLEKIEKHANYQGWWLSPDGQLFDAPDGHVQFIRTHPEFFGESDMPDYEMAFSRGWIRIAKYYAHFAFNVPGVFSDSELTKIQEVLLDKFPRIRGNIRISDDKTTLDAPYDSVMLAQSVHKLKKDVKFADHRGNDKLLKLSKRAKDPLLTYKKKRDFDETKEPEGKTEGKNQHRFVIQRHKAKIAGEHFDLRLENDQGTMSSWAIPKHKLPKGKEKLLATKTEDHPVSYMGFKGEIPEGEYGAGRMAIHDSGKYDEIEWSTNKIVFKLSGKKEKGTYTMIKTDDKKWLIMQKDNSYDFKKINKNSQYS